MPKRYTTYCPYDNTMVDFFDEDVVNTNEEGFWIIICPYCGHRIVTTIKVTDLMETADEYSLDA